MTATVATPARLFDGRTTTAQLVSMHWQDRELLLQHDEQVRRYRLDRIDVSEAATGAPCAIRLPDGGTAWVDDTAWAAQLRQAAGGPGVVGRLIADWRAVAVAALLLIGLVAWLQLQGVGLVARALLPLVPDRIDREIGNRVWTLAHKDWLKPTQLKDRCLELALRFNRVQQAMEPSRFLPLVQCRRVDGPMGFNAFALPNGQIVLLDGLVRALSDDELMAVLGHELAHVRHRDGLQAALRQLGLLAVAGAVVGDFSGTAATMLAGQGSLAYSRDTERKADAEALLFLRQAGLPPQLLAQTWQRFADMEKRSGGVAGAVPAWLSSHPSTEERLQTARAAAAAASASSARP